MAIIYDGSMDKELYKDVFGKTLETLVDGDSNVVYLDADLMNSFGTHSLWKRNKRQAINCGISEANMMGVAAGLSASGKKPCVHTFGPFATRRSYDQSFLSIAYAGNSVRIFGSDPGVTAAFNGGTHMPFEDMGVLRSIPEITLVEPADNVILEDIIRQLAVIKGVYYIRMARKNAVSIYQKGSNFHIGRGNTLVDGTDVTIFASGIMVYEALKASSILQIDGVSARIVDMFTWKPIDSELVDNCARITGAFVTAENHNIIGGLGSAIAEVAAKMRPVPIEMVGVKDRFGQVGTEDFLREEYELTATDIVAAAKRAIERKG